MFYLARKQRDIPDVFLSLLFRSCSVHWQQWLLSNSVYFQMEKKKKKGITWIINMTKHVNINSEE